MTEDTITREANEAIDTLLEARRQNVMIEARKIAQGDTIDAKTINQAVAVIMKRQRTCEFTSGFIATFAPKEKACLEAPNPRQTILFQTICEVFWPTR